MYPKLALPVPAKVTVLEFNDITWPWGTVGLAMFPSNAVGTASYEGAYTFTGYGDPYAIRWNNDGTKLFMVDTGDDKIVEYSVENAYDVTSGTITENASYLTTSYESAPTDVAFNSDGTKMFTVGNGGDEINEWSLSTGFDLTSTINLEFLCLVDKFLAIKRPILSENISLPLLSIIPTLSPSPSNPKPMSASFFLTDLEIS